MRRRPSEVRPPPSRLYFCLTKCVNVNRGNQGSVFFLIFPVAVNKRVVSRRTGRCGVGQTGLARIGEVNEGVLVATAGDGATCGIS